LDHGSPSSWAFCLRALHAPLICTAAETAAWRRRAKAGRWIMARTRAALRGTAMPRLREHLRTARAWRWRYARYTANRNVALWIRIRVLDGSSPRGITYATFTLLINLPQNYLLLHLSSALPPFQFFSLWFLPLPLRRRQHSARPTARFGCRRRNAFTASPAKTDRAHAL